MKCLISGHSSYEIELHFNIILFKIYLIIIYGEFP